MSDNKKNTSRKSSTAAVKAAAVILVIVFAIITQTGCGNKDVSKTDFALNTSCTVTVCGMPKGEAEDILEETFAELRAYEKLLSRTIEGSDVYNINHAGGNPVEVSEVTIDVIRQGILMGDISDGRFDITVGKVSELWDFTGENPKVPSGGELDNAVQSVDYRNITIEGTTVALNDPEAAIDLGGIAKGYIADRLAEFLELKGVKSAVVNLGGNVVLLGNKSDGTLWNVGVERPYSDRTELMGAVEAADATLVTSGIYERKFEENGVLYHHVLDVKTGYPAETDLESVTIMANRGNSAFCDGLSTICLALGKQPAMELVQELQKKYPDMGLEAAFIDKTDDMVQTEGMNIQSTEK